MGQYLENVIPLGTDRYAARNTKRSKEVKFTAWKVRYLRKLKKNARNVREKCFLGEESENFECIIRAKLIEPHGVICHGKKIFLS